MTEAVCVLKKNSVRMAAPKSQGMSAMRNGPSGAVHGGPASARIIQQTAELALVEITCECGTKIVLQCQLEPPQTM